MVGVWPTLKRVSGVTPVWIDPILNIITFSLIDFLFYILLKIVSKYRNTFTIYQTQHNMV